MPNFKIYWRGRELAQDSSAARGITLPPPYHTVKSLNDEYHVLKAIMINDRENLTPAEFKVVIELTNCIAQQHRDLLRELFDERLS